MELRNLRYFIAVAEEKNFTRAAARLGIKQPPLSLQIRKLEKEMGAQLLHRGTRSVELTNPGRLLLEEARAILRHVERAKTDVRRSARGETGSVNVGYSVGTTFNPIVPSIIREYGLSFPQVILHPQATGSALQNARLHAGTVDLAFIYLPSSSGGLAIDVIVEEPLVVALPIGHRLSRSTSLHLTALADEKLVIYAPDLNPVNHNSLMSAIERAGFTPKLAQYAPVNVAMLPMVAAGLGWAVVPQSYRRILPDDLAYVSIEDDMSKAIIGLAHRRHDQSVFVRNFVACAKRQAAQQTQAKSLVST
jgi:DNA-binding transcriptional LysR family regulator